MATKLTKEGAKDYKGTEEIDLLELSIRPERFQGVKVVLSGTVLLIEPTLKGKDYIVLDVPMTGEVKDSVEVAVDWEGALDGIERGVALTLWGTVAGAHLSGGPACGLTLSPLVAASRLEIHEETAK